MMMSAGMDSAMFGSGNLLAFYRTMLMSRSFDDKEIILKNQNRVFFQLSSAGHEAISLASALVLRPAYDWLFPHVRDRAMMLHFGLTPYEQFLSSVAAQTDIVSGARQMPSHWGCKRLNLPSRSSCIGMQFLQAVGAAEAGMRGANLKEGIHHLYADEIVYVGSGDGGTSEGEFWESLNTACNLKLPVLYVIQDNGYAISVPVEVQTADGSISRLLRGFPDLFIEECDGTDLQASYATVSRAASHCRARRGPALVHARVTRPYSHSMSDDESLYRAPAELAEQATQDPLIRMRDALLRENIATTEELQRLQAEVKAELDAAADEALQVPHAPPESATLYVYSPDVDPTSAAFDTEP